MHMDAATRQSLDRVLSVAMHDTSQSKHCADFLLAWWNADENGGFDLTALWGLDSELVAACSLVFIWLATRNQYPDDIGYGPQFRAVWQKWRQPA